MKGVKVYKHGKLKVKFTTFKNELFVDILEQDEKLRNPKNSSYLLISEFSDGKMLYQIASVYHPQLYNGTDDGIPSIVLGLNGSYQKKDNITTFEAFKTDMRAKEVKWIFKQMIKEINKEADDDR